MWVKTIDGRLVNLANADSVAISPGSPSTKVYADMRTGLDAIYSGENCVMVMADIEHGIVTGAVLVDLMKRETFSVVKS